MSVEALEAEVKKLKEQFAEFQAIAFTHVKNQERMISSRRGEPGPKGDSVAGPAGRDAVLIVKTDIANNTVHIFDEGGNEKATLVAVPGPAGRDGVSPAAPKDGAPGKSGKDAPSLDEIVKAVLAHVESKI